MKNIKIIVFLFVSLNQGILISFPNSGSLGVGVVSHEVNQTTLPSLSSKYYLSSDYSFGGSIGLKMDKNNSSFILGGKIYRHAFQQKYSHFFMDIGLFVLSSDTSGSTGFEINGSIGSEFFFSQLEKLGFSFEVGIALRNGSGNLSFKTFGGSFMSTGIHYYF